MTETNNITGNADAIANMAHDKNRLFTLDHTDTCYLCNGSGIHAELSYPDCQCPVCKGSGEITVSELIIEPYGGLAGKKYNLQDMLASDYEATMRTLGFSKVEPHVPQIPFTYELYTSYELSRLEIPYGTINCYCHNCVSCKRYSVVKCGTEGYLCSSCYATIKAKAPAVIKFKYYLNSIPFRIRVFLKTNFQTGQPKAGKAVKNTKL